MKLKGKSLTQTVARLLQAGQTAPKPRVLLVDAQQQVVGRLANQLAIILQGKDRPDYCPWEDKSDIVAVLNARRLHFTGNKWEEKTYRWHTGYPGGLKERTAAAEAKKGPERVLLRAVAGMLPKNSLRRAQLSRLFIFSGPEHPFAPAQPLQHQLYDRSRNMERNVVRLPERYTPTGGGR